MAKKKRIWLYIDFKNTKRYNDIKNNACKWQES